VDLPNVEILQGVSKMDWVLVPRELVGDGSLTIVAPEDAAVELGCYRRFRLHRALTQMQQPHSQSPSLTGTLSGSSSTILFEGDRAWLQFRATLP
jgi:hypothetical protein